VSARLQVAPVPDGYLLVIDQLDTDAQRLFANPHPDLRDTLRGCVGLMAVPFRLDVADGTESAA
jgi:hypothetical protein